MKSVDGYLSFHWFSLSSLLCGVASFVIESYKSYSARSFQLGCPDCVEGVPWARSLTGATQRVPAIAADSKNLYGSLAGNTPRLPIRLRYLVESGLFDRVRCCDIWQPSIRSRNCGV